VPSRKNSLGLDLHIDLGGELGSRSIETALREAVTSSRLPAGMRLPGTRSLAHDLGIARGTVVEAYSQLVAEGWLVSGERQAHAGGCGGLHFGLRRRWRAATVA
jgi:DNA-binding transcriptional MocR family regulator